MFIIAVVVIGVLIAWLALRSKPQTDVVSVQRAKNKLGDEGEALVAKELRKLDGDYHTYNDVLLKVDRGIGTTQIDHLVVSKYGIFVIETKNWAGKIYGKRDYKSWVRIKDNGRKNFFGNALQQNDAHIDGILSFLPRYAGKNMRGLVVFSERGTLMYEDEPGVGYYRDTVPAIKKCTEVIYSENELTRIKRAIETRIINDDVSTTKHVRRAKGARYARLR